MQDIEIYIQKSIEERQSHLEMHKPCIERGGDSVNFRGLLAFVLDTSIPSGYKIHLCHACHNKKCSNPNHLYWGTPKENSMDYYKSDFALNVWQRTVLKYGEEQAKVVMTRPKEITAKGGRNNKGKPKSIEHRKKLSESLRHGSPTAGDT